MSSDSGSESGSGSGSESGSGSGSGGGVRMERLSVLGARLRLPRDLCENADLFREVFSLSTWNRLAESECRHLRRFLPDFPENDAREKEVTLRRLFDGDAFRFGSPLVDFQRRLSAGVYRPRAQRLRRAALRARRRLAARRRRRMWRGQLAEVAARREALLDGRTRNARNPPPDPRSRRRSALEANTKRRYFGELASVRDQAHGEGAPPSDEEDYPEGPPPPLPKNLQRVLKKLQDDDTAVVSTLGRGFGPTFEMGHLDDEWRQKALIAHAKRKRHFPNDRELDTIGITVESVRSRVGDHHQRNDRIRTVGTNDVRHSKSHRPQPPPPISHQPPVPEASESEEDTKPEILPAMMNLDIPSTRSVEIKSAEPEPPCAALIEVEDIKLEVKEEETGLQLVQATHSCFLSVIRDLVCSTSRHCLPLQTLESLLRNWRQNPIAPLNHWYNSVEDWLKALPSAISFLTGESTGQPEDFVPYLQYKSATQVYQWIGAGRDSDALLLPLCAQWLSLRQGDSTPAAPLPVVAVKNSSPTFTLETIEGLGSQLNPKWNSRWQVSAEELEAFRTQEVARFQRPHRAFTYRLPRGEIVVGPLKGVYGCDEPGTGANRVARGHTLLTSTRPRHVTLLALVRDAVACLPGGEGTRAHIAALVRRSQYIVEDAPEQPLQAAVSGALDRMHGAPDPCVQYLPPRKLWVYLHGNRTEEEFERLHAEMQVQSKNKAMANLQQKKSASSKSKSSRSSKSAKNVNPPEVGSISTVHIEEEADAEDMNIDVEGPELPITTVSTPMPPSTTVSSEKVNVPAPILSGTSLLQPRAPAFTSTVLKRGAGTMQVGNSRSVVRVLSSSNTPGKSLISPNALQPTASQSTSQSTISTAKFVVQRPANQISGTLTPMQQKRIFESLMKHQKQQSHSIHSKMASPPVSVASGVQNKASSLSQALQLAGQTVQLPSGQTVQLTGQAVQLTGQTVQLGGQTVQIGNQTVQLAGQSIQLISQSRPAGNAGSGSPVQRQATGPLVAKLLTNAQLRNTANSANVNQSAGLRVSGLSLAQLQGKPLLLQTNASPNKSSNIFLQASGSANSISGAAIAEQRPTAQRSATPTTQHTLLLGNIGGQVVRVAGSGALIGSTLRLQSPSVQGNSGMILGGHTLKLQTAPMRLHQNAGGNSTSNRVLLTTSGSRLHSLKILPVLPETIKGTNVGNRQVYARIVSPADANSPSTNSTTSQNVVVGVKPGFAPHSNPSQGSSSSPANQNR